MYVMNAVRDVCPGTIHNDVRGLCANRSDGRDRRVRRCSASDLFERSGRFAVLAPQRASLGVRRQHRAQWGRPGASLASVSF